MRAPDTFAELEDLIAAGVSTLPASFRELHAGFLAARMGPDGGFAGRRGGSDLYYTAFGLRAASLLGMRDPAFWERASDYVRARIVAGGQAQPPRPGTIEWFSLLASAGIVARHAKAAGEAAEQRRRLEDGALAHLESVRSPEGGYAESPGGQPTLYHTFLAARCLAAMGRRLPDERAAAAFVLSRRRADGGFSDSARPEATDRSGTNPTAAAVALLSGEGALSEDVKARCLGFVISMQRPDGGFAAHAAAPGSDLLSSFTALTTAALAGDARGLSLGGLGRFVKSLACVAGGFRGSAGDGAPDVEYSYYGVATAGALAAIAALSPANIARGGAAKAEG